MNQPKSDAVNILWLDAILRHQVFILRASGSLRDRVNLLLKQTEADVDAWVRSSLDGDTAFTSQRLAIARKLIKRIQRLRNSAWTATATLWVDELADFILNDANFYSRALQTVVPVVLEPALPTNKSLLGLVKTGVFEGRTLKEWAESVKMADLRRIEDQIKIGLTRGEAAPDIARRIVGSVAKDGLDGSTQLARNDVQTVTRTALAFFSNGAREAFFMANADIFTEELFVATLDARTTPLCRSLDGNRYPIGRGYIPPLHFNCRSIRVALIGGSAIGSRPAKPMTERMLLREFAKQQGLGSVSSREGLPYGMKGAYDSFSRTRIREMTEIIPARTTYQEWLTRQSAEFQDDVLGPARGSLFRQGGMTLKNFVDASGKQIRLSDLAMADASAFSMAGLDPFEFYE